MNRKLYLFTTALVTFIWLVACQQKEETAALNRQPQLPEQPFEYAINVTPGIVSSNTGVGVDTIGSFIDFPFGAFFFNGQNPGITNAGATLGRVLFYDPQLSLNNRTACASCHKQELAFSDGLASSSGFAGKMTPRNSMAIINPGFNNHLFWDSRETSVKDLVTRPIQNHIEMGIEEMRRLEAKLAIIDYYPGLFQSAFGDSRITEAHIADALAQFVCSITTTNSRFDRISNESSNFTSNGQAFPGFTTLENMGKALFFSARTNCSRCHAGPNFAAPDFIGGEYGSSGGSFEGGNGPIFVDDLGKPLHITDGQDLKGGANNGLDLHYTDAGMGDDKFRIPSLRNIAMTGPYMHDGRFKTLEEVIEHYSTGIAANANLDKNLRNADGSPLRPNLNALEKKALIAFLNTLTDETLLTDPKYSNPFN